MEILRLMVILLLIILIIVIGAKAIYSDNYAIICGTISNGEGSVKYPSGFTPDNCVVISKMLRRVSASGTRGYAEGGLFKPADATLGSLPILIELKPTEISIKLNYIYLSNGNTPIVSNVDYDVNYKIVLMKIEEINDWQLGDVNMDGQITEADYNLAFNHYAREIILTDKQFELADVNKDGKVNADDMREIQKMYTN